MLPHALDPASSLRRRYLLGKVAIVCLSIASVASLEWALHACNRDAMIFQTVLGQVTQCQRLASAIDAMPAATLQPDTTPSGLEYTRVRDELVQGHERLKSQLATSLIDSTAQRDSLLMRLDAAFARLAKVDPQKALSEAEAADADYLLLVEEVGRQFVAETVNRTELHSGVGIGLLIASLILTAFVAVLVFEPAVQSIRQSYDAMVTRSGAIESKNVKAEETARSLRESLRFNDAILQTAADGIVVIDRQGKILSANPSAHRMFGLEPGSLIGSEVTTLMGSYDREHHHEYIAKYEQTGASSVIGQTRELVARRGDMDFFPIELSVAVMEWDGRRAYTGFLRDVSERRDLQNRLAQAEKLESIGRLAAGIAHEINTPLQFINANTQYLGEAFPLLAEAAAGGTATQPEKLEKIASTIQDAINDNVVGIARVSEIVKAMKEFSHPGEKLKSIGSVNTCVQSAVTITRNRWKGVADLELQLDEDLPACDVYVAELNQALLNLIVNAADAIGEANGSEAEPGKITIRTWADAETVNLVVEDSGPGVPDEVLAKIFDPFFTTKGVGKGTGQGLSIARDIIVKLHGGVLAVENRPEGGASFTIRLPLSTQPSPLPEEDPAAPKCPFAKASLA
ncbi:two-component system sensor histidine kinase NtrB [Botrimarina mediterranea]|uniref:histidine kinase n=1 Tax=Botrimarina mediterranea TaxID=2528022 RepID=A0A518KDC1_9BACT|nr:ATP-binding protein [Botrimarina mediterranea]QDV75788.1 Sensor protein FixL [Botrimarina mediterranea]QDV80385.1 Sensor protein FixL [Planctomycetes bacterium K2D]